MGRRGGAEIRDRKGFWLLWIPAAYFIGVAIAILYGWI